MHLQRQYVTSLSNSRWKRPEVVQNTWQTSVKIAQHARSSKVKSSTSQTLTETKSYNSNRTSVFSESTSLRLSRIGARKQEQLERKIRDPKKKMNENIYFKAINENLLKEEN